MPGFVGSQEESRKRHVFREAWAKKNGAIGEIELLGIYVGFAGDAKALLELRSISTKLRYYGAGADGVAANSVLAKVHRDLPRQSD